MKSMKLQPLAVIIITAMLTACGGADDWQTGIPGSGGTGVGNISPGNVSTSTNPIVSTNDTTTIAGTIEAVTATTVKINGVEYKITPQTKYINSQKTLIGVAATVIVSATSQEVISIDQVIPTDSTEVTSLKVLISNLAIKGYYEVNNFDTYTHIISPTITPLEDYHWISPAYTIENRYVTPINWIENTNRLQMLMPSGEWSSFNDQKIVIYNDKAQANINNQFIGSYTVTDFLSLVSQGYPENAQAVHIQYIPYQDEYIVKPIVNQPLITTLTEATLEALISEDKNETETEFLTNPHHAIIFYGYNKNRIQNFSYTLVGNPNEKQGKVKFTTMTDLSQGCPKPISPTGDICMTVQSYSQNLDPETGTWERINIAGNDIIKITPPASIKDSLIEADKEDEILVKQANSTENVKSGKFYPANQPVNMTWYNQTAMDYILKQGLSTVFYK